MLLFDVLESCVYTQTMLLTITESKYHIIGDEGKVRKVRSGIYDERSQEHETSREVNDKMSRRNKTTRK